ncbi:MAG TPA: type II secretion system F family protein [Mycobacteriales bacterium]
MTVTAAAMVASAVGVVCWPAAAPRSDAERRVRRVTSTPSGPPPVRAPSVGGTRLVAVIVAVITVVLVRSPAGVAVGVALGLFLDRFLPARESRADRRRRAARDRMLPSTLDLLAVGLHAGLAFGTAAEVVATARGGPLADDLARVASLIRLGAAPTAAWADYAADPVWGVVARAVARSADSGNTLAATMERVAEDRRAEAVQRGEGAARRASVIAMAPLGLCFLPAFVSLGVIPVVIGLAAGALR